MSGDAAEFKREAARLSGVADVTWLVVDRVDSTNRLARRVFSRLGDRSEFGPLAILAWHQTAGRGRAGRRWFSTPGGSVLASILRRVESPEVLSLLPLLVGVSLADGLSARLGLDIRLRWPNDLYVGEAKIGGILIEAISRGTKAWAVVGFGINYETVPLRLGGRRATSLLQESARRPRLAEVGVDSVSDVLTAWGGSARRTDVVEKARQLSVHQLGEPIRLFRRGREVCGVFRGLDAAGGLLLETSSGTEAISAGEVVEG